MAIGRLSDVPSGDTRTASTAPDNSANLPSNLPSLEQDPEEEQVA